MSLMPVRDALNRLLEDVKSTSIEHVELSQANGRFLSRPVASTRTQPPFAASAMDGYAIRHADLDAVPAKLHLIGEAPAGHGYRGTVNAGETVRIFTGAPVPNGADTILIQENTERDGNTVTALERPVLGAFVRPSGLDFKDGDQLLIPPLKLGYRELALAAAMNHASLPVYSKPKVAILATGDELVRPGTVPGPDQIIASNHAGLAALVEDCGGVPFDLGISPDNPEKMAAHVAEAIRADADVLVTLGGASVGDHDLVQDVLGNAGMDLSFWRIAMRPGKPLMAGNLGRMKVLGLPGNPVSSLVCGLLFLRPLLGKMLGASGAETDLETVILGADLPQNDQRQDYVRAALTRSEDGQVIATPFVKQDSSMLALLAKSGALIVRPPFADPAPKGATVPVLKL